MDIRTLVWCSKYNNKLKKKAIHCNAREMDHSNSLRWHKISDDKMLRVNGEPKFPRLLRTEKSKAVQHQILGKVYFNTYLYTYSNQLCSTNTVFLQEGRICHVINSHRSDRNLTASSTPIISCDFMPLTWEHDLHWLPNVS